MSFENSKLVRVPSKTTARVLQAGLTSLLFVVACSPVKFEKADESIPSCSEGTKTAGMVCPTPTPTPVQPANFRQIDRDVPVGITPKNVDILIVDDNSRSMETEQRNMAEKFPSFVHALNTSMGGEMNWQLGIVTTDMDSDTAVAKGGNLVEYNGAPGTYVVNRQTYDVFSLFSNTIQMTIDANHYGSGDERGIYAAKRAVEKNQGGWLRSDATLSVIILSDEDERTNGGQRFGQPMEAGKDYPSDLINAVQAKFGTRKKLTVHSIIVPPGDVGCLSSQRTQEATGANGEYGTNYKKLSELTGGIVGTVCADDYGSQLTEIGTVIEQTLSSIPLECTPIGNDVRVTPKVPSTLEVNATLSGDKLTFSPPLPEGSVVNLRYKCPAN